MGFYELQNAPTGRLDGSGMVDHDIWALDSNSNKVPSKHATFQVHADDLEVWSAMPDSTTPEKQAKNDAYRDLLVAVAPPGWTSEDLDEENATNEKSVTMASEVDDYIVNVLNQEYPVKFSLPI